VPSRGTLERRIARLDPAGQASAREGPNAARVLRAAGGVTPPAGGVLEQVQIDHTMVDVIVVDGRHQLPVGRPYVTAGIDVFSRCIVGLVVTLEAPSALSAGLCLAHMATSKRAWLERLGVTASWPMTGKPRELYARHQPDLGARPGRRHLPAGAIPDAVASADQRLGAARRSRAGV
jgi:putative transposase